MLCCWAPVAVQWINRNREAVSASGHLLLKSVPLIFLNVKLSQKDHRLVNQQQVNWMTGEWFWPTWNRDQLFKVQWEEQWILPTPPSTKKGQKRASTNEMSQEKTTSIQGCEIVKIGFGYALTWQQGNGITGFAAKYFHLKASQQIMSPSEDE